MSKASPTLSMAEAELLARHEAVIAHGLETFYEVGKALLAIRDNRLYRARYKTFGAYCRERWDWSPQHAGRQIEAAKIVDSLEPRGSIPTSERQARELGPLPVEARRAVWEGAVAANGGVPPAARALATVVRHHVALCRQSAKSKQPPMVQKFEAQYDQEERFHHQLTELMLSIEILGEAPAIDLDRAAFNILMADSKQIHLRRAIAAQEFLTKLIRAMEKVRISA